jgi:antitoxin (DNA-binding transcriptional repressor) of toxin-antitoxin stability system
MALTSVCIRSCRATRSSGFVERARREHDVPVADDADDPVAQIAPLEQHEDDERDDEAGRGAQAEGTGPSMPNGDWSAACSATMTRVGPRLPRRRRQIALHRVEGLLEFAHRAAIAQPPQLRHLRHERRAVARQLAWPPRRARARASSRRR